MRFYAVYDTVREMWLHESRHGWYWRTSPTLFDDEDQPKKTLRGIASQNKVYKYGLNLDNARIVNVTLGVEF